jgi:hypothetical protein
MQGVDFGETKCDNFKWAADKAKTRFCLDRDANTYWLRRAVFRFR